MSSDLYVALSGAVALMQELDVVANNLANADTAGFKRDRATFLSALEAAALNPNGERQAGAPASVFTRADTLAADFASGPVKNTGAPLDVAIQGEGFFEVRSDAGTRYTRAGSFTLNERDELVAPGGYPVIGDGGPISVGDSAVEILASGAVVDAGQSEVGRLKLVRFENPAGLSKDESGLFRAAPDARPVPVEDPLFAVRSVEGSNVAPVQELADLVLLQRSFDVVMRVLQSDDEARGQLIREVGS